MSASMVLQSRKSLKDVAFMTLKNKIKHEIELITQLKKIGSDNQDITFGANMAYDIMIERLNNLLKKA